MVLRVNKAAVHTYVGVGQVQQVGDVEQVEVEGGEAEAEEETEAPGQAVVHQQLVTGEA